MLGQQGLDTRGQGEVQREGKCPDPSFRPSPFRTAAHRGQRRGLPGTQSGAGVAAGGGEDRKEPAPPGFLLLMGLF